MIFEKTVKVKNKGMICLPDSLRKKYNIKDGDHVSIIEDENGIRIIPIEDRDSLRRRSISAKKMLEIMEEARKEELELEY